MSGREHITPDSILRLPDVEKKTGLSGKTIYRRIKDGTFPKSVSLGIRAVGWSANAVNAWVLEHVGAERSV